jgi:hypothetical protein
VLALFTDLDSLDQNFIGNPDLLKMMPSMTGLPA